MRHITIQHITTHIIRLICLTTLLFCGRPLHAQTDFVHPGGLHTTADLDRMKAKVAAGEHPWIDCWNDLIANPKAQFTYVATPYADMDTNRQQASADAVAAYLNSLRWYISGDTRYADCAVRIMNAWSSKVNVAHIGFEGGLMGIPAYEFAVAGEVLRTYPGWAPDDFTRFKSMMTTYIYPTDHDFLVRHDGLPITHYWANWDICNMTAILAIGVLCDDRAKFDEAIDYFKHGKGNGSIEHAVPYLYKGGLGQWQESGRDQEHAQLGVGMMATFCQIAWNQGVDLYGYDHNRLLAGAEYVAAYNMWKPVPYTFYNNEDDVNQYWISDLTGQTGGNRGRLQRPIWEMIYNHYVVLRGLKAPYVKEMAEIYRPEGFEHDDNFGFGTLAYTLDSTASPFPPAAVPPTPRDVTATGGVGRVWLKWTPSPTANGYNVERATTKGGPYTALASFHGTFPLYEDDAVTNGVAYYYVVSASNQLGASGVSKAATATPAGIGPLPTGWSQTDIGTCIHPGSASYADVSSETFVVSGSGSGIGVGSGLDGVSFTYTKANGDFTFTARRPFSSFTGGAHQRTGIMIRQSLDPTAMSVAMITGDLGAREARFGARLTDEAPMTWQAGNAYSTGSTWLRLKRSGSTFTGFQSIDGITWYAVGSPYTVPMTGDSYVGFAVSSNSDKINGATFDNVSIER